MYHIFLVECNQAECADSARIEDFFRERIPEPVRKIPKGSQQAQDLEKQALKKFGLNHPVWGIMNGKGEVKLLRVRFTPRDLRYAHYRLRVWLIREETIDY